MGGAGVATRVDWDFTGSAGVDGAGAAARVDWDFTGRAAVAGVGVAARRDWDFTGFTTAAGLRRDVARAFSGRRFALDGAFGVRGLGMRYRAGTLPETRPGIKPPFHR